MDPGNYLLVYICRWVLPNTAMKKKVRHIRYIKYMKVKVRSYDSGNIFVMYIYHLSWTIARIFYVFSSTLVLFFAIRFNFSNI